MVTRNPAHVPDEQVPTHHLTPDGAVPSTGPAAPAPVPPTGGLGRFWEAADALPDLSTTLTDWRARLGPEYALVFPFLRLRLDRPRSTAGRHRIEAEYEVDRLALADAVADALGLRRDRTRDSADRALAHLGPYGSPAGPEYTCYLTYARTTAAVGALARRVGAGTRVVLLSVGRRMPVAGAEGVPGGGLLVPLAATVLASGPGRLCRAHPIESSVAWAAHAAGAGTGTGAGAGARNAITRTGAAWVVTFEGRTVSLGDLIGVWYVSRLIQSKRRPITASELRNRVHGRSGPEPFTGAVTADRAAVGDRKRECQELVADIARARRDNDPGLADALRCELDALAELARGERGLGGRPRRLGDESTTVRTGVKNAIDLVIKKLRRPHPALARHLEISIHTGASLCYDPSPDVDWEA